MANGKDALSYALSTFIFSSIDYQNEQIKEYWTQLMPNILTIPLDENIENPFQQVKLFFGNEKYFSNGKSPKVIILNDSPTPKNDGDIILEASSGEDCARLLCISHTIAQRFAKSIHLVITKECLNQNLKIKAEHIPLPPKYIIRDQSWKPDAIFPNHPALNFKRISYGNNMGPRDKAELLIISHGRNSLIVNKFIETSQLKNKLRHLEIQTLRPISKNILNQAMQSVKKTIALNETFQWLEQNQLIEPIELNEFNDLLI